MNVRLVYGNHNCFGIHVADTLLLIQKVFELAGCDATIEHNIAPGQVNVVLEGFDDRFASETEQAMQRRGSRLIIVATEYLTGRTFNKFDGDTDESHYSKDAYWSDRFANFVELEKLSTAVWHLGETEVAPYREFLGHERVFYLPHFWADGLSRVQHAADTDKDIDFLFTGTETAYRRTLLNELMQKGYRVETVSPVTASFHRENLLARSKLSLNIRQNAQWQHPSPSRFFYHLINASLLITEMCTNRADIQEHVLTAPAGKFIDFCEEQFLLGDFTNRALSYLQNFRQKHPLREVAQRLVDATFS